MFFESIYELRDFVWFGEPCSIIDLDLEVEKYDKKLPNDYTVTKQLNEKDTDDAINYCNYIIEELAKAKIRNSQKEYDVINNRHIDGYSIDISEEDFEHFREYIKQKAIWLDSFIAVMQSRMKTILSYQLYELSKH